MPFPNPSSLLLPLLAAPLQAQAPGIPASGVSGSETHLSSARGIVAASSDHGSASYLGSAALGGSSGDVTAASEQYVFTGGVTFAPDEVDTDRTLVFGAKSGSAPKSGGTAEQLFGFNFDPTGAVVTTVGIGGAAATNVTVQSETVIDLIVPPGVDDQNNPLGLTSIKVKTGGSALEVVDAFTYLPAVVATGEARIGGTLQLIFETEPGATTLLITGSFAPSAPIAFPGFGTLALTTLPVFFPATAPSLTGSEVFDIPIADNPAIVGFVIEIQAFALTNFAPPTGSFTNYLTLPVQG